jgi:predicted ATP-dependent endonuclease of OLD family
MITRIEASGYRCFHAEGVGVDFGKYNILAGRNGAGKTTLLDIPVLLGDMIRTRYCVGAFLKSQSSWTTPRAHTLNELFFQEDSNQLTLAVEAALPPEIVRRLTDTPDADLRDDEPLSPKFVRYELRLELFNGVELQVRDERLFLFPGKRRPAPDLDLQRHDPERFERWVKHVRTGIRQVRAIRAVEREEDHHAYVVVTYENGYEVTSSGLSEGTLRLMALTLIPYLPAERLPAHLVIEQPEDGIHPRAFQTVLDALRSVYDCQVWVSPQSPLVLAHSDVSHVLCASIEKDGSARRVAGQAHPRLKNWKGAVDLGTLLATGVLG